MSSDSEKTEKTRESARKHFFEALETYKAFAKELRSFDRKFFDFRIAFIGFLGIILTIIFSNKEVFSSYFLIEIIGVFIFSYTLLLYEIWHEGKDKMQNLNSVERTLILHNILNSAAQSNMNSYVTEAINTLIQEHKIMKFMKENKSIEEIVNIIGQKRKWKWGFFVWGLLAMSVPILFLLEFLCLV